MRSLVPILLEIDNEWTNARSAVRAIPVPACASVPNVLQGRGHRLSWRTARMVLVIIV